jgi:hypothetical protein
VTQSILARDPERFHHLEILQSFEKVLGKAGVDLHLDSTRQTFGDILEACLGHYHLHA